MAEAPADRDDVLQVVELVGVIGEAQAAAAVPGDRLAGLFLESLVELDAIAGHAGEGGRAK
jgi:hypothetical protein